MFEKVKRKVFDQLGFRISRINLKRHFSFKQDTRETAPFKLLFFSGSGGVNYLNASLISVYNTWEKLPEVLIVTDGTPVSVFEENIIDWPKKVEIITWAVCASYYRQNGNADLHKYAAEELWGKKLVSILYYAEKYPVLYSDTDILWFSYPKGIDTGIKPCLQMGEDIEPCYSRPMLTALNEEKCLEKAPLNAGLIFANGDFATYSNWKGLCTYLSGFPDFRTEQTAFAILNNYFNPDKYWNKNNVLINTDDKYSLRYTKKDFPSIFARHYVNNKDVTFWRDFVFMKFKKKKIIQ